MDDSPANLLAFEAVLASPDYELVSARSGCEALVRIQENEFAVVLLDVQMPSMDGFETALEIKRLAEPKRHVPILLITAADVDRSRLLSGYASGAVDFIQKPVEPAVLRTKVSIFVDLFRTKERLAAERTQGPSVNLRLPRRPRYLHPRDRQW